MSTIFELYIFFLVERYVPYTKEYENRVELWEKVYIHIFLQAIVDISRRGKATKLICVDIREILVMFESYFKVNFLHSILYMDIIPKS